MPRTTAVQNSFTTGEIDAAQLDERRDVKYFYSALAYAENVICLPQGGATRRPGLRHAAMVRAALSAVTVSSGEVSAPNGGTIANLIDASAATLFTAANGAGNFVAFSIDKGAAFPLVAVDVTDFVATTRANDALVIETSLTGSSWTQFGLPVDIRTDKRTRRFAMAPGLVQMARYVRARVASGTIVSLSIGGLKLWQEGAAATTARLYKHTFSRKQAYMHVVSDGNLDVYLDGVWKAAIAVPIQEMHLAEVTTAQALDTMLLFHQDVPSHRIFRQGDHHEWDSRPAPFVNIPIDDFGGVYTNGVHEIQQLDFDAVADNDRFTLTVEGETTEPIQYQGINSTTVDNIRNAIEALPNVQPGLTVAIENIGWQTFLVTFTGEPARDWQLMAGRMISGDGFLTIRTNTKGKKAGEPIMSDSLGWPRCGVFRDSRLILGGFKALPQTLLVSLLNDPYNFDPEVLTADGSFTVTAASDDSNIIHRIHIGRHLLVFTDSGEWWSADRKISKTEPFSLLNATTQGIAPGVPIVATEGVVLYSASEEADDGAQSLQEFSYSEVETNYGSQPFSLLGAHLTEGVVDMAMQKPSRRLKTNLLALVRQDGGCTLVTVALSQQIRGMARMTTEGLFRAVAVDGANIMHFIVERTVAGQQRLSIELMDWDCLLDAAVIGARAASTAAVTGLSHLQGATAVAWFDGAFEAGISIVAGAHSPSSAVAEYQIGRSFLWSAEPLPYMHPLPNGAFLHADYRVSRCTLALVDTGDIAISANGGRTQPVPLHRLGSDLLDVPLMERLFTGKVTMDGLRGFSDAGRLRFSSTIPGPATLKAINYDVSF